MGGSFCIQAFSVLAVLVTFLVTSQCQMDKAFCQTHRLSVKSTYLRLPKLSADFETLIEGYTQGEKEILQGTEVFSVSKQNVYIRAEQASGVTQLYVLVKEGIFLEYNREEGERFTCHTSPIAGTPVADTFHITYKSGEMVLPPHETLTVSSVSQYPMYVGEDHIRGIPVHYWHVCTYTDWDNVTQSSLLYYNREDVKMPGAVSQASFPVALKMFRKNGVTGVVNEERNDYFNFKDVIQSRETFQVDPRMWCDNRRVVSLPFLSQYFKVSIESTDFGDPTLLSPYQPPVVQSFTMVYQFSPFMIFYNMELDDSIASPLTSLVKKEKVFLDFTTATKYHVKSGKCEITPIDIDYDLADVTLSEGGLKPIFPWTIMNSLYKKYQHMGEHVINDRGIPADVYTNVEKKGTGYVTTTIWYFASRDFILNTLKAKEYYALPLRVSIETSQPSDFKVFDLYDYHSKRIPEEALPVIYPCLSGEDLENIELWFDQPYDFYLVNGNEFMDKIHEALLAKTGLQSLVRISFLRVDSWRDNKIYVKFGLTRKAPVIGSYIKSSLNQTASSVISPELRHLVDSRQFSFVVASKTVTAVKMRTLGDPKPTTETPTASSGGQYTPAHMGGLALCMLVLGLVAGLAAILLYRKVASKQDSAIDMMPLP